MENSPFQTGGFFVASSADPTIVFTILGGILVALAISTYGVYRYQKWRRFKVFENEMQQLGLNPNQEGTFGDLVRRYKMNDPIQILYSLRMFDEIASREMERVLGSPGSMKAKNEFIQTLYEIRERTYLSKPDEIKLTGDELAGEMEKANAAIGETV